MCQVQSKQEDNFTIDLIYVMMMISAIFMKIKKFTWQMLHTNVSWQVLPYAFKSLVNLPIG